MTINTEDMMKSILDSLSRIDYVHPEDIPNIDLYMDQVTTFMNDQLKHSKRYEEDKILTKTMINNYAKNNLLPPPVKKKYSKEHVLVLIFIYYFKNILSIKDIDTILSPLTEQYFSGDSEFSLIDIYNEVFSLEKDRVEHLKEEIAKTYETTQTTFQQAEGDEKELLHIFSFICTLSFDVYVKKMLIEKLVDSFAEQEQQKNKKKN